MKKILLSLLFVFILIIAYQSKPSDKDCIIKAVRTAWGAKVPDEKIYPQYFEQFMDVTSTAVKVDDWIFLKRISYKYNNDYKTVGYGLFKQILML